MFSTKNATSAQKAKRKGINHVPTVVAKSTKPVKSVGNSGKVVDVDNTSKLQDIDNINKAITVSVVGDTKKSGKSIIQEVDSTTTRNDSVTVHEQGSGSGVCSDNSGDSNSSSSESESDEDSDTESGSHGSNDEKDRSTENSSLTDRGSTVVERAYDGITTVDPTTETKTKDESEHKTDYTVIPSEKDKSMSITRDSKNTGGQRTLSAAVGVNGIGNFDKKPTTVTEELKNVLNIQNNTVPRSEPIQFNTRASRLQSTPFTSASKDSTIIFNSNVIKYSFLSNHYISNMLINGITYKHVEGYYHSSKFIGTDDKTFKHLSNITSGRVVEVKGVATKMSKERSDEWNKGLRISVMKLAIFTKFITDSNLSDMLLATGDKELIHVTESDRFWSCDNNGNGNNVNGKILMKVRDCLRYIKSSEF